MEHRIEIHPDLLCVHPRRGHFGPVARGPNRVHVKREADARVPIAELNRTLGLNLPEDAGYETLGGFLSTSLGQIPEPGAKFEKDGVKYTVLDAEPQKINRVRIEMTSQMISEPAAPPAS